MTDGRPLWVLVTSSSFASIASGSNIVDLISTVIYSFRFGELIEHNLAGSRNRGIHSLIRSFKFRLIAFYFLHNLSRFKVEAKQIRWMMQNEAKKQTKWLRFSSAGGTLWESPTNVCIYDRPSVGITSGVMCIAAARNWPTQRGTCRLALNYCRFVFILIDLLLAAHPVTIAAPDDFHNWFRGKDHIDEHGDNWQRRWQQLIVLKSSIRKSYLEFMTLGGCGLRSQIEFHSTFNISSWT